MESSSSRGRVFCGVVDARHRAVVAVVSVIYGADGIEKGNAPGNQPIVFNADGTPKASVSVTTLVDWTLDPDDVSGLVVWIDADQDDANYNDGDAVGTITNWGSGADFVQATAAKKPTFKTSIINGHDVYRFDGGDCAATSAAVSISTFAVIAVLRLRGTAGMLYEQSAITDSNNGSFMYGTAGSSSAVNRSAGTKSGHDHSTNWLAQNVWIVPWSIYRGTHGTHQVGHGLFQQISSTTSFGSADPGESSVSDTIYLGARNNTSLFITGDVAEFLIYSPAPTSDELRAVINGLMTKYQIP